MGWEKRGSHTYYYLVKRIDRKAIKIYLGRGIEAHAAAEQTERNQQHQQIQRRLIQKDVRQTSLATGLGQRYDHVLDDLTKAVFLINGFTRPKFRDWRQQRVTNNR